jgi:hypothetical protein
VHSANAWESPLFRFFPEVTDELPFQPQQVERSLGPTLTSLYFQGYPLILRCIGVKRCYRQLMKGYAPN